MQATRLKTLPHESAKATIRRTLSHAAALIVAILSVRLFVVSNAAAAPRGYVSGGSFEDNNSNVVYENTWTRVSNSSASGGTFTRSNTTYATASLYVGGAKSFQIMGVSGPNRGIAKILIDGNDVAHLDTYNPSVQFGALSPVYNLPNLRQHKISVQVSGTKNSASSGYGIAVDKFIVTGQAPSPSGHLRRVNAPYFSGTSIPYEQTAIVWLGQTTANTQYGDIRIGYSDNKIFINANVMDRFLWYNENPSPDNLTSSDSVSLYLSKSGTSSGAPDGNTYRFDAEFTWWESDGSPWRAAYQGNGSSWSLISSPFTTQSTWRGNRPNDNSPDSGFSITFRIPYSALGLSGPPPQGTIWGLGIALHNRNDSADSYIPDQVWPENMSSTNPMTWGQLRFGLMPGYNPPSAQNQQTVSIRQNLNGQTVATTNVGGYTLCGTNISASGGSYWDAWGTQNWAGKDFLNVMNQNDPADWPCYNKVYANFPLGLVPAGKVITSAKLTVFQFAHAGQGSQNPGPSLFQVLSTDTSWNPSTINWNNAPWPNENGDRQWAGTGECFNYVNCPAVTFDVSQMVANAYAAGQPLRVILYDADSQISSGKYVFSSDQGDWNASNRPVLQVTYGDP